MASIVLGTVTAAAGKATGLSFAPALLSQFGRNIANNFDNALLSPKRTLKPLFGPRLAELGVQTSTYGKVIPIVYGIMRIGGNIIWSLPIKETVTTSTSSAGGVGKGGGGKVTQTATSYSYSVTLAIGICEGPVDEIMRIWADAKQLDLSQYVLRLYNGDETQVQDTLIQSIEGAANTPAYRGLAYVVIEDFPLADYGNRIPNFTFEVRKRAQHADYENETLEDMITGMVMIPGAGEFVYDTQTQYKIPGTQVGSNWVQQGSQERINMHNAAGKANALLALDQLQKTCPNVEWVSVVVSWFGTSMDAGTCTVLPGVEYQEGAITSPDSWQVAGFTRGSAHQITLVSGSPQYGGTPSDNSILRYLDELIARGYKIAFYPLMFMDVSGKPWRGELTGSAANVSSFFTKTNGYNAFINHYADLVKDKVDAFIIGSEMKGLTKVTDTPGNYPAVNQLVSLAAAVKTTVGAGVKVTYAADWSEYHHTDGGWYNLDPLWASSNIDMIGIDAYFPLSDAPQSGYDIDSLINGWTSGEGYDWYYSDPERTTQVSLSAPYAWKNLSWFWSNAHVNPDSSTTGWVPESKKIWFTEYGFPSVDGAANQPNVFYDPNSSSSALPYHSKGRIDFMAQRAAHMATQIKWKDSTMVEQMFIWTWDARPFPYWPDLTSVWSDGPAWKTGHWVQGKFGISSLAAIVSDLCQRAGIATNAINVNKLVSQLEGFVINSQQTIRDTIETLQLAYFFDVVDSGGICKFVPRGGSQVMTIEEDDLAPVEGEMFSIKRVQEVELPKRVNIVYLSRLINYQSLTQYSQREATLSRESMTLDLPIVFPDQIARNIADVTLYSLWMGRTSYQFYLAVKYARLEPSDVVGVIVDGTLHRMRIVSVTTSTPSLIKVQAVAEDTSVFDFYASPANTGGLLQENRDIARTRLEFLDIPAFPDDVSEKGVLRLAAAGLSGNWTGSAIYRSDDNGANYSRLLDINAPAAIGTAITLLANGPVNVFDHTNSITVVLIGNSQLQSVTELAVLNGANAAMVGNELIQFTTATLVEPGKYTLSGLLRGRLGSEWATATHVAGERFVLLDSSLGRQIMASNVIGLNRHYKPVSFGSSLTDTIAQEFSYSGVALKPYSPVHITGERDGSGNLSVNWVRRSRLGGNWLDGADVPLNETAELYEIDIMDGSDVVRTIGNITMPSATYSSANQVIDFGSAQPSIAMKIYQMSGVIGRGYAGTATV
jgi:hypothetical protein